ncbi:MAG: YqeG family HAD IIIA-type phosphatase [Eubacteriales bacterium]|nr:YqeG family HAD IIIA-type phosphatase [Eubacteriales bacterium]
MFKRFYPDWYVDSAYKVDYKKLYDKGYRGIIFDVDNTLVEHGAPVTKRAAALFESLRKTGFDTCIISNNKETRVKPLAEQVASKYVSRAKKPSPVNYVKAMNMMGTDSKNTLFIGDQLFTDVWGANRAGIKTILVKPIDPHEEIQIVLKRRLEWIVLYFYRKSKRRHNGKDYIILKDRNNE